MKKISKSDKFILVFIGIPTIVFIIYSVVVVSVRKYSLSDNIEYTYAVVDSVFSSVRGRNRLNYIFSVQESQYRGTGTFYPNNLDVFAGDSILIVYDRMNPHNTEWYRNYNTDKVFTKYVILFLVLIGLYHGGKWWKKRNYKKNHD